MVREVLGRVGSLGGVGAEPVETVLKGADDAVSVAGGEGGLPAEHPVGVELREHKGLVYWSRRFAPRARSEMRGFLAALGMTTKKLRCCGASVFR